MYYDIDGIPISVNEWGRLHSDDKYVRVERTTIMDGADPAVVWEVSTVWLGIDHSFDDHGPPVIFETMVFAEGSSADEACERYNTLAMAKIGHHAMVATVAATATDPIVMSPEM